MKQIGISYRYANVMLISLPTLWKVKQRKFQNVACRCYFPAFSPSFVIVYISNFLETFYAALLAVGEGKRGRNESPWRSEGFGILELAGDKYMVPETCRNNSYYCR